MEYKKKLMMITNRFWSKVDKVSSHIYYKEIKCWTWIGATNKNMYGYFRVNDKIKKSHRISWEIKYGQIPEGKRVLHHCDNPPCVNPEHLFLGTDKDNSQDALNKGRLFIPYGERHGQSKLTEEQVKSILKDTRFHTKIATDYNVSRRTISYIKRGEAWKHVK